MKRTVLAAVIAMGMINMSTFGGEMKIERKVSDFDSIQIKIAGKINLRQSDTESLSMEGDKELLDNVIVDVKDHTLVIKNKNDDLSWFDRLFKFSTLSSKELTLNISVKKINSISVSGSCSINMATPIKTDSLYIKTSGRSTINCPDKMDVKDAFTMKCSGSSYAGIGTLSAKSVDIDISGSGNIRIDGGAADTQKIDISGSGKYSAKPFKTKSSRISCSGSGTIEVDAQESLYIRISGSGSVIYSGNPSTVDQRISGSGSIRKE